MSGAAMAASRGLRSLTSRFARGGGAPLRAALLASPAQPRAFRTSLVVEMGRRAAKIANRKARSRSGRRRGARAAAVLSAACVASGTASARADAPRRAGERRHGAREAVWPRGEADRGRVRAPPRGAARRSRREAACADAPRRRARGAQRQVRRPQREQQRHAGGGAANRAPEQHPKGAGGDDASTRATRFFAFPATPLTRGAQDLIERNIKRASDKSQADYTEARPVPCAAAAQLWV